MGFCFCHGPFYTDRSVVHESARRITNGAAYAAGSVSGSDGIRVAERVSVSPERSGAGGDPGGFENQWFTKSFLTFPYYGPYHGPLGGC